VLTWKDDCFYGRCSGSQSLPGPGFDLLSAGLTARYRVHGPSQRFLFVVNKGVVWS
jgi:hypothetical protein